MIQAYLRDTIVLRRSSQDNYQKETFTDTTVKAFIDYKKRWVTNQAGAQVMSGASVMIKETEIDLDDRIRFDNRDWKILQIKKLRHFSVVGLEILVA